MTTIKKYKLNKLKLLRLIIFFILFITFIISAKYVITWIKDNKTNKRQLTSIQKKVIIDEIDEGTAIYEDVDQNDPYWDFIKMNLINVDFKYLIKQNSDTVGWIQVNGTNINYPFVQASDNEYYLNHSFDKSWNMAGWLFLDYRNKKEEYDKNTIIYGHGMKNKTMFGSLRNILNNDWVKNTDNYVVKISTEYENTLWQVFSVYKIITTNDYIETKFDDEEFEKFINMLLERSAYNFNTTVNANDKILTLSTCYNSNEKVVLHAKLIKKYVR